MMAAAAALGVFPHTHGCQIHRLGIEEHVFLTRSAACTSLAKSINK